MTGRPEQALVAGVVFGLARGLGIALAGLSQDSERLRVLMARVDAAAAPSVAGACVAHAGVAAAAVGVLAGPVAAAAVGAAALVLGIGVFALSSRRTVPTA